MHLGAVGGFVNNVSLGLKNTFEGVTSYQLVFDNKNVGGLHVCYLKLPTNIEIRKYRSPGSLGRFGKSCSPLFRRLTQVRKYVLKHLFPPDACLITGGDEVFQQSLLWRTV
ncbi:hypothetical protein D083_1875 [Dickeya solani RNS 08.23.3.1.A]|nr:hypothetical protein D083_1875 [Dickeya solani RNS 08.23.3.1.A]